MLTIVQHGGKNTVSQKNPPTLKRYSSKSIPTRKLNHTNSILEYFEYFCQISSKSILIILSYTVSKLVRFF